MSREVGAGGTGAEAGRLHTAQVWGAKRQREEGEAPRGRVTLHELGKVPRGRLRQPIPEPPSGFAAQSKGFHANYSNTMGPAGIGARLPEPSRDCPLP